MKHLIGMTDFVLVQDILVRKRLIGPILFTVRVADYAIFLKQPQQLWMFVPCDLIEGKIVILSEGDNHYQQAKERCLFENHDLDIETIKHHINLGRTVEYFASFETLQLTPTALKQIGV